jgi:hypothetical protein
LGETELASQAIRKLYIGLNPGAEFVGDANIFFTVVELRQADEVVS